MPIQSKSFARFCKGKQDIRKVAPEPSSFAIFDKELKEEINMTHLKDCVLKKYHEYFSIFSKQRSQRIPEHTIWNHAIELKPSFKPQASRIFPLSPEKHKELGKFIKEHLLKRTIC